MANKKPLAVIIPAAGFGQRMQNPVAKQFINVGGKTILAHTIDKIQAWAKDYSHHVIIMVALSDPSNLPADIVSVSTCLGGKERADSVANALAALEKLGQFDWVLVHDAARPLIQPTDIEKLYQSLKNDNVGGILAEKVTATVKRTDGKSIIATVERDNLWLAQTPQLFRFALLKASLQGNRQGLTDEASGIEAMQKAVKIVAGSRSNIKITTAEDLAYFSQQLAKSS